MTQHRATAPYWIDPDDPVMDFPGVELALREPDGLLALGGDLCVERLLLAYSRGIFPWFGPDQPILWWAPDPRLVLEPAGLKISHSLKKTLRQGKFEITMDMAFNGVIEACAKRRPDQSGTWITAGMMKAYRDMHSAGHAHSVECWYEGELAGGLYGVAIGRVFFGESMFTRVTDASKVAFVALTRQLERWGFPLIDCQVHTGHLESLGASMMPRQQFSQILQRECHPQDEAPVWALDPDIIHM